MMLVLADMTKEYIDQAYHAADEALRLHPWFPAAPEPTKNVGISGEVYKAIHLLVDGQTAGWQLGSNVV